MASKIYYWYITKKKLRQTCRKIEEWLIHTEEAMVGEKLDEGYQIRLRKKIN